MNDLDISLDKTLGSEGFYTSGSDKSDSGGETIWGIARNKNTFWKGWPIVDILKTHQNFPDVCKINEQLISLRREFYQSTANSIGYYAIPTQELANDVFDTAVNQGIHEALLLLKES